MATLWLVCLLGIVGCCAQTFSPGDRARQQLQGLIDTQLAGLLAGSEQAAAVRASDAAARIRAALALEEQADTLAPVPAPEPESASMRRSLLAVLTINVTRGDLSASQVAPLLSAARKLAIFAATPGS